MKILLLSDTHGNLDRACQIYEKLNNIDLILHCGDYQSDAEFLEEILGASVISVKGNCDHSKGPDYKTVDTPCGKILITHGHMEFVNFRFDNLLYLAEENHCFAACFGHTHAAMNEDFDGIRLINPGSLTEPRDGSGGTFAVLDCTDDGFSAEIIAYSDFRAQYLEDDTDADTDGDRHGGNSKGGSSKGGSGGRTGSGTKSKIKGGFLRRLLNYSDRF